MILRHPESTRQALPSCARTACLKLTCYLSFLKEMRGPPEADNTATNERTPDPTSGRETQQQASGRIAKQIADNPVSQTTEETVEVTPSGSQQ